MKFRLWLLLHHWSGKKETAERKKKKIDQATFQAIASILTVIVAFLGIAVSYMTVKITREQNEYNRKAAQQQFEDNYKAEQRQFRLSEEAARSERFMRAIEHLKDELISIRMGALLELQKIGLANKDEQAEIVRILESFIIQGIELPRASVDGLPRPDVGIFFACEIVSLFAEQSDRRIVLANLKAEELDLKGINLKYAFFYKAHLNRADLSEAKLQRADLSEAKLQRADLSEAKLQGAFLLQADLQGAKLEKAYLESAWLFHANLQGANLFNANLQGADLNGANLQDACLRYANLEGARLLDINLQGADFWGTNLQGARLDYAHLEGADLSGAKNLTAEELLYANLDDTTKLAPALRAEYNKLKAAQEADDGQ